MYVAKYSHGHTGGTGDCEIRDICFAVYPAIGLQWQEVINSGVFFNTVISVNSCNYRSFYYMIQAKYIKLRGGNVLVKFYII